MDEPARVNDGLEAHAKSSPFFCSKYALVFVPSMRYNQKGMMKAAGG